MCRIPFNEKRLEKDFDRLTDFLLNAGQKYFLYRDFQSANVMVVDREPWFIDYQGGGWELPSMMQRRCSTIPRLIFRNR
ncbi:MAG: hypothetical protein R2744_03720 [Bacteroidales bacterium]